MVPLDPFLPMVLLDGGCEDAAKLPLDKCLVFIRMLVTKISVGVSPTFFCGEPLVREHQRFLSFYRTFAKRQVSASQKEQMPVAALDA